MTLNQIYIYIIPAITITTTLYLIYFLTKHKNINKIFEENLKELREKEAEEFDNFIRSIQAQKKEVMEECISSKLYLANDQKKFNQEIRNNFIQTINELKENENYYKKKIKELEKEILKYKNICNSKVKKIERLEKENSKLKMAK